MTLRAILDLSDGARLAYRVTGRGRPLVFVHGWGMGGTAFEHQHRDLSARFRVVSLDLRGHGGSSPLAVGQGLDTLGLDLVELLAALDLDEAVLVGWSLGAMVCWEALARAPQRIAALVVIDMVPRLLNDEGWKLGLRAGSDAGVFAASIARMRRDWPAYTRVFVPRIFARDGARTAALIEQACALAAGNDPESMARLWAAMVETDYRDRLPGIRVPTLIVHGERSQLYRPAAARALAAAIPGAREVGFADSGHSPHLEQPELFNRTIEEFADDPEAARSAQRHPDPVAVNLGEKP